MTYKFSGRIGIAFTCPNCKDSFYEVCPVKGEAQSAVSSFMLAVTPRTMGTEVFCKACNEVSREGQKKALAGRKKLK